MKLFQDNHGQDPVFDNLIFSHYMPNLSGAAFNLLSFMIADAKDFYAGAFQKWYTLRDLQRAGGWGNPAVRSTNSPISAVNGLLSFDLVQKFYNFERRADGHGPVNVKFDKQKILYCLNTTPKTLENRPYIFVPDGSGHYTTMPRALVMEVRPRLSNNAWKLAATFMRHTWGFRAEEWHVSFAKLRQITGIKHNLTMLNKLMEVSLFEGQGLFEVNLKGYNHRIVEVKLNRNFTWAESYPQSGDEARGNCEIYPQNGQNEGKSYPQSGDEARGNCEICPQARGNCEIQARGNCEIQTLSARKLRDSDLQARGNCDHVNTESFLNKDDSLNKEEIQQQQQQTVVVTSPLSEKLNDLSQAKHEALKLLGITNKYGEILDKLTANENVTLDMVNEAIRHQKQFAKKAGLYVKFLKGEVTLNWEDSPKNETTPKLPIIANDPTPPWDEYPAANPTWEAAKEILAGEWDGAIMSHLYGVRCEVAAAGNFTLYATNWVSHETLNRMKKYIHKAIERAAGGVVSLKIEVSR